jgi:hypothetical protein
LRQTTAGRGRCPGHLATTGRGPHCAPVRRFLSGETAVKRSQHDRIPRYAAPPPGPGERRGRMDAEYTAPIRFFNGFQRLRNAASSARLPRCVRRCAARSACKARASRPAPWLAKACVRLHAVRTPSRGAGHRFSGRIVPGAAGS